MFVRTLLWGLSRLASWRREEPDGPCGLLDLIQPPKFAKTLRFFADQHKPFYGVWFFIWSSGAWPLYCKMQPSLYLLQFAPAAGSWRQLRPAKAQNNSCPVLQRMEPAEDPSLSLLCGLSALIKAERDLLSVPVSSP